MAKLTNHIAIILDRSSSMQSIKTAAMGAFNEQVATLKKETPPDQENLVTLVTFSSQVDDPIHFDAPVSKLSELATFEPDGNTALVDAVGYVIEKFRALPDANDPNTSFLVTVITDGEENASRKWTPRQLASAIKEMQDTKRWTFTYLCTATDLAKIAEQLAIPVANVASYSATTDGMYDGTQKQLGGLKKFMSDRSSGSTCTPSFYNSGPSTNAPSLIWKPDDSDNKKI